MVKNNAICTNHQGHKYGNVAWYCWIYFQIHLQKKQAERDNMNVIKKSNTAWDFIIESLAVKNMLFQSNARMMPCMVNYHSEFF